MAACDKPSKLRTVVPDEDLHNLAQYRERLVRFVRGRLDRRLQSRIDASDVVQEACAEAVQRLPEYKRDREVPFYVWLRFLTAQRLALTCRRHLGTQQRDARRDVPFLASGDSSAAMLADHFAASQTSPSSAAAKAEMRERLQSALEAMAPADREVLALRHFEQMSNAEAAAVLELSLSAASHRYARALLRMKTLMVELFGPDPGSTP